MAGSVLPPPAARSVRQQMSASFANSFRIAAVAERLAMHIQFCHVANSTEFSGLCLSLARGIDYAVANNEVPPKAQEFPLLLKQDTGPQLPTNVTAMLKYGTNLLQAVGQFNGHYIIVVAFMSVTPLSGTSELQDYVQSNVAAADSDSDIIEGPSRVSLNCPISYTRIKTPVKGHSCKHLQCFDFRNFVNINSRRPSWRCPHCNQHLCCTDIRIDQNMVKVLKEVGEKVANVIISADGSWKAVLESDETADQTLRESISDQKEMPEQQEPASSLVVPPVVDLTKDNGRMDVVSINDVEDRKPIESQPMASNLSMPSLLSNAIGVDQNVACQVQDEFWSGVHFNHGSGISNAGLGVQHGFHERASANILMSPVITDAISSALNHDIGRQGNSNVTPLMQNHLSASDNLHLQQSQIVNNMEYGRSAQIPRNVSRTPIAIQALPALSQTSAQPQRSRDRLSNVIPIGSSFASQVASQLSSVIPNGSSLSQAAVSMTPTATGFSTNSNHMDRQQQFPRSHANLQQTSLPLRHHSAAQNRNQQDQSFISGQSAQQVASLPALSQLSGSFRASFALHNEYQNLQQEQATRITQARSQSPILGRSSPALPQGRTLQGVAQMGAGSGNAASYINRFTVPVQFPTSGGGTSYSNTDVNRTPAVVQRGNVEGASPVNPGIDSVASSEQNWRPTGRMRGSLSSQAAAAYGDLIIQPTQPSKTPQPPPNLASAPPNIPPNM